MFELETYKPRQNWQDTILVAVCAIAQMAVGVLITVGTLGGGTTLGVGIFTEGLMDAYKVAMSVHKGESINLESYFLGKAISYAIIGAQVGFNKLAPATTTARTAGTVGATETATTVGTKVGTAGTTEIVKDISTSQLIAQLAKTSAIQFATVMAIEKTVDWVSEGIRENALDGLEERIAGNVGNAASQALSNNSILLTANCNIERNQIMTEIQKAIFQATKTGKHAMVINQLASGIAGAAANSFKGSGIGFAVKVTHAAVTVVDVIAKIDPIIDNIKDAITTIINQAGTRAKERLGNKVEVDGNQVLSNDLSRNIGEMAANSMLSLLQRKVTPTLNLGVSYVADQMVGKYQKEQTNLLEKYSQQFIADKKETSLRDMTSSNMMSSKPPPLLSPHKMSSSSAMSSKEKISFSSMMSSQRKLGYNLAPQPESTGLAGLTGSDLALASLLPKPGSGDGGSNSILLLSSAMQQPIYVFENGKFLQSYGKGLGGTPITIGYDSKNQQYFGFTNKGSSNSGSIFEAISASSNGKYSADILRGVVQPIPVADTTPPKPPSQLTPQPKPLSQSELSAAQFLVDTLTADKQQLQAKENEYHRNILQIAKQNMHDSAAKKFARDEALMQQAYAMGGEPYLPLKRVEPGWQAKNLKDVFQNSLNLVIDPKYGGNLPLAVFSTSGDLIDCGMQQIVHVISGVEGGADTLKVLGYLPNKLIGTVKDFSKDIAKEHLPEKWYKGLSDWCKGLPENTKVTATLATDSMILWGAGRVLQIASGPATSKLYSSLEKGVAAEASAFTTVGKASEIGLVGENTITKPSSMLTKVDDFGLAESGIHGKIEAAIGNKPIVTGSLRELTALEIKLACEELVTSGEGKAMAGAGHTKPIKDIKRIVETYGGSPEDWAKMFSKDRVLKEGVVLLPDTNVQLHYYKNIKTGQVIEIKPVIATKK
ncbi:hypothetical protein [Candidatus Tisiphia endosymbiont of Dascillus cervinus]|uniref:hypothetical protein n=1 Tax=Candidatus Tisiphia endosymbiont of Dascillus cervinus TaxID=3066253 RepID=UPI00312CB106